MATFKEEKGGSFLTSDAVGIRYRDEGPRDGVPVVFCYGLACSAHHFKYQWRHLAERGYRVLMPDYRGHHLSDHPPALVSLTLARIADDVAELLDHAGIERAHVIGHSMGVNVVLETVERHPSRIESIVLIAGSAGFPAKGRSALRRLERIQRIVQIVDGLLPGPVDEIWKKQSAGPLARRMARQVGFNPKLSRREDIDRCVEVIASFPPRVFFQLLGEYVGHDQSGILRRIRVPSLVISGEKDRMVPARCTSELARMIRGSRHVEIPDGSHCPQIDRPGRVNAEIEAFLEGRAAEARPAREPRAPALRVV